MTDFPLNSDLRIVILRGAGLGPRERFIVRGVSESKDLLLFLGTPHVGYPTLESFCDSIVVNHELQS